MRNRGNALLTTLVWIALIMCLAFGLAGLTVSHLGTVSYEDNRQLARVLARSVVSTAIARVMYDTDFGKADTPSGLLTVRQENGTAYLSFEENDKGIPRSTNNFGETLAAEGSEGRSVPPQSARLVGVARVGAVTQRVECLLAVPAFPYAIAASGTVEARGGLVIGALKELVKGPIPAGTTFDPADLLANGTGAQSVFLGQNTKISGDVRAGGTIVLDPVAPANSIQVQGQLKSNSPAEKIPDIDLAHYDPIVNGSEYTRLERAEYGPGPTKMGGIARRQGNLTVTQGLYLDGGTLFVDGNLTVHGGLTGKGILAVDGNVTLDGQTSFDATSGVALLASHNLNVSGSSPEGSYFQGLLYTEGAFTADKLTLIGCLVAGGEPNDVRFTDSRMLQPAPPEPGATPAPTPVPVDSPGSDISFTNVNFNRDGKEINLTGTGPAAGPITMVITIEDSPSTLTVVLGEPSDFQPLYQTDDRIIRFLNEHNVDPGIITTFLTSTEQVMLNATRGGGKNTPTTPPPQQPGTAISLLDPSSFLNLNEKIRIVLWKED